MSAPLYVPASGGDDAPAINAALLSAKSVILGAETYQLASTLVVPTNATLRGQGRATQVTKLTDIDMIDLGYGASIEDFWLSGSVGGFTGRGVVVRAGQYYQRMVNVHVNSHGYCVDFEATDAGSHMTIDDCFITRSPSYTSYSIKMPASDSLAGGNRTLRNVRSSGGYGVDLAGAHNTSIDRCNMALIRMDAGCKTLLVQNSRIIGPVEWRGQGLWVAFNNISNGSYITPQCYQSLFIMTHSNTPIGRQDPPANANTVW
jgi:hypothetical protein